MIYICIPIQLRITRYKVRQLTSSLFFRYCWVPCNCVNVNQTVELRAFLRAIDIGTAYLIGILVMYVENLTKTCYTNDTKHFFTISIV